MRNHRILALLGLAIMAGPSFLVPTIAHSQTAQASPVAATSTDAAMRAAIGKRARGEVGAFYQARGNQPIWIKNGLIARDAQVFLRYLDEADLDGLKPSRYKARKLRERIAASDRGGVNELARAEVDLTKAFAKYVRDMRKTRDVGMEYADKALVPTVPTAATVLRAATIRDFDTYVAKMGWMSPHYVRMRGLVKTAREQRLDQNTMQTVRLNLERARVLPPAGVRHIVVDASEGRLWYYQAGDEAGTMKVVVGTAETQTPMLAGNISWAIVNPYWNIPDYLAQNNVAKKILSGRTLASMKMEVLSDWSREPAVIDPKTVNWQAVADGTQVVRIRELPHKYNSMGKVKFLFPNDHGIYLHDTPSREYFQKEDRHISNGCVRLEDATRLGRWMMGDKLDLKTKRPEEAAYLPAPVPVYLTYFTAAQTKQGVALRNDLYARDTAG
ncbi:L,D-transpeptidase [Croceicoccus ponticola]|uniref:L,D-transpeptidase n=1 Tax=Croceicoccus ponticola TaxID=2217664 RepID=A0A437GU91_9SPHN|nr:L,D-transpeptidase family protein [Croceicoccus ponticola]RVQ64868.1 L,D-transpeptidase [Croceicoccus ponticola]